MHYLLLYDVVPDDVELRAAYAPGIWHWRCRCF